jgi:hypothetical protein
LAAASVLLAGACSSGDGGKAAAAPASPGDASRGSSAQTTSQRFCNGAKALYDELEEAGVSDPSSPAVKAVFADAQDLVAPDEIADDWATVLDSIAPLVNGEVNVNDAEAMAAMTQRAAEASDAFQHTGTYFEQRCGFGATTTSAP